MKKINWGIIGCGDVTEVKSGPAFNKVSNSSLVAVMRRDGAKVRDYARRHNVPKWYDDASQLINDPDVNAIYIATPPSTHEYYTLAAIDAGKPVYVEKPMTLNYESALNMIRYADLKGVKLSVAHYRRAQPLFGKIKQLLEENAIGDVRFARLDFFKMAFSQKELHEPKTAWRVDPAISGGGLFHDLAPHQLDLMYYFFGPVEKVNGITVAQVDGAKVDDMVAGNLLFENGVAFSGAWCFNAAPGLERDGCEIFGASGKISFSVFETVPITLISKGKTEHFSFDPLPHVQHPMIDNVVQYFLGKGPNPCSGADGAEIMRLIDEITKK